MSNTEIEIKVKVEGVDKLLEFLEKDAHFEGEEYQKDEYFVPTHRDFLAKRPVEEWLRLRQSDKNAITYKNFHFDENGKSVHADEYETDLDDIDQMRKILEVLNFKPGIVVEKNRRSWRVDDYEVSIDSVTDIGDFVEVEYKGSGNDDPKSIAREMVQFLKDVGCTNIQQSFQGYPFMALYPDEVEFEDI